MNALLLLMGLLLLSYIGSFLVGGRAIRGFGLSSGSEYLLLGFVIGPSVLGLVDRAMLDAFEPIADVALGWLSFVLGLDYAFLGRRRVRAWNAIAACVIALLTGGSIAVCEFLLLRRFTSLRGTELLLLAGGIGAACSETTRHAVRWVVERHRAEGPLSNLLAEFADSDDLLPILATALLFALVPAAHTNVVIPQLGWAGITVGLGVLLGSVAAVLLARELRLHESWGVLLGTSLFAIGLAARLNLSFVAMMFFMGIAVAALSRHHDDIAAMVAPTERPVLLPALVLAGARIDPQATPGLAWIVGAALAVRIAAKLVAGFFIWLGFRPARPAGPALGLGLLSAGALAMTIGLAFALRFPGPIGDTVLFTVSVVTIFGEFVGPGRLRAALSRAGEIADVAGPGDSEVLASERVGTGAVSS